VQRAREYRRREDPEADHHTEDQQGEPRTLLLEEDRDNEDRHREAGIPPRGCSKPSRTRER
jgi:hypothetical protein